uniref:Uncharacterized protein n=1 Tax=Meloidogyne floridensis TaxID=298350 RepID=A0A915P3D7_9BILA
MFILLKEDQTLDKSYVQLLFDDLSDEDVDDLHMRITITLLGQKIFEKKNSVEKILEKEKNSLKEFYKSKSLKKLKNKGKQKEVMQVEMIEHKIEVIEKMFEIFNIAEDNLNSNLPLNNASIASINILAEFYFMLKSIIDDKFDLVTMEEIVNKYG